MFIIKFQLKKPLKAIKIQFLVFQNKDFQTKLQIYKNIFP